MPSDCHVCRAQTFGGTFLCPHEPPPPWFHASSLDRALEGLAAVGMFVQACRLNGWADLPDYVSHRYQALDRAGLIGPLDGPGAAWRLACQGARDVAHEDGGRCERSW